MPHSSLVDLDSLLPDILTEIFRHVPLKRRLAVLGLVCVNWHKAATAATDSVQYSLPEPEEDLSDDDWCVWHHTHRRRYQDFDEYDGYEYASLENYGRYLAGGHMGMDSDFDESDSIDSSYGRADFSRSSIYRWLQPHGSQLTSLCLSEGYQWEVKQLPCPNLLELRLVDGFKLQLASSSSGPGVLGCSKGLTKLVLLDCHTESPAAISHLASLTLLQRLELSDQTHNFSALLGTELQQLQQLSHLTFDSGYKCRNDTLQHFSSLMQLQELVLLGSGLTAAVLRHLTPLQRLQRLKISASVQFKWTADTAPAISKLTSLTSLHLNGGSVHAAALQSLTQLLQLHITSIKYDPHIHKNMDMGVDPVGTLELIAKLQRLQVLQLSGPQVCWPAEGSQAYSALTASSNLQQLLITGYKHIPADAWQHAFGEGKCLPHLQVLQLSSGGYDEHKGLDSADLARIACVCPALRQLRIDVQPDTGSEPLLALQQLTMVSVNGATAAAVSPLTALTRLRSLSVYTAIGRKLQYEDVLPLTVLQRLTMLSCSVWADAGPHMDQFSIHLTKDGGKRGAPSAVWEQLQHKHSQDMIKLVKRREGLAKQRKQQEEARLRRERQQQAKRQAAAEARAAQNQRQALEAAAKQKPGSGARQQQQQQQQQFSPWHHVGGPGDRFSRGRGGLPDDPVGHLRAPPFGRPRLPSPVRHLPPPYGPPRPPSPPRYPQCQPQPQVPYLTMQQGPPGPPTQQQQQWQQPPWQPQQQYQQTPAPHGQQLQQPAPSYQQQQGPMHQQWQAHATVQPQMQQQPQPLGGAYMVQGPYPGQPQMQLPGHGGHVLLQGPPMQPQQLQQLAAGYQQQYQQRQQPLEEAGSRPMMRAAPAAGYQQQYPQQPPPYWGAPY